MNATFVVTIINLYNCCVNWLEIFKIYKISHENKTKYQFTTKPMKYEKTRTLKF